jgi:hypothetical protein
MRHIGTLIAAFVIAPMAWILLAFGQDRSVQAFAAAARPGMGLSPADFVRPFEYLAAAGLILGIIATLRFSPLGAVLTGFVYSLSYAVLLVAPQGVLDMFSHRLSIAGRHADPTIPIRTGTTLVIGALMLVAVVSAGRWRRWPRAGVEPTEEWVDRDRPVGIDGLDLDPPGRRREPELVGRYQSPGLPPRPNSFAPATTGLDWPWGSSRPRSESGW